MKGTEIFGSALKIRRLSFLKVVWVLSLSFPFFANKKALFSRSGGVDSAGAERDKRTRNPAPRKRALLKNVFISFTSGCQPATAFGIAKVQKPFLKIKTFLRYFFAVAN